jgi:hypothetical protein
VMSYRKPTIKKTANHRRRPTHEPRLFPGAPWKNLDCVGQDHRDMDVLMFDRDGLKEQVVNLSALPQNVVGNFSGCDNRCLHRGRRPSLEAI